MAPRIVVLGAGVSGLTSAYLLAQKGGFDITVVAKHMPGDYDIEYASPWAGANYLPVASPGSPSESFERNTWSELARLARDVPEAGIHFQDTYCYKREKDNGTAVGDWFQELMQPEPWFKDFIPDFRPIKDLPPGMDGGSVFTSVCINTALYLPWLASQCLKLGVKLRRGNVAHVTEINADVVVNATGLSSLKLGGVEDKQLYPARGQITIVRNDPGNFMGVTSGVDDGPDEAAYIMHRAAGGGCVLGGCLQKDNWDPEVDQAMAQRIMKRAVELCPRLSSNGVEGLDVIRHGVGLRPMRHGGPRVEREVIRGVQVVHNYGHGGYGFQTSYGCAQKVIELVREATRV